MLSNSVLDAAFDSIFGNLLAALRISLIPFAIAIALVLVLNFALIKELYLQGGGQLEALPGYFYRILISLLVIFYAFFFVAVKWHRFSIGTTGSSKALLRPAFYGVVFILIVLFCLVVQLPLIFVAAAALQTSITFQIGDFSEALALGPAFVAFNAVSTFIFAVIFMRLSPTLVSIALGAENVRPFAQEKGLFGKVVHIAVLYTIGSLAWSAFGFMGLPAALALVVNLVLTWIVSMLSIAILTEIYKAGLPAAMTPKGGKTANLQNPL